MLGLQSGILHCPEFGLNMLSLQAGCFLTLRTFIIPSKLLDWELGIFILPRPKSWVYFRSTFAATCIDYSCAFLSFALNYLCIFIVRQTVSLVKSFAYYWHAGIFQIAIPCHYAANPLPDFVSLRSHYVNSGSMNLVHTYEIAGIFRLPFHPKSWGFTFSVPLQQQSLTIHALS
jgi:hypothetical protein